MIQAKAGEGMRPPRQLNQGGRAAEWICGGGDANATDGQGQGYPLRAWR